MNLKKGRIILVISCIVWVLVIGAGLGLLWRYENTPGATAVSPARWPSDSAIRPDTERPTLIMLTHPHCPCSRASIGELARLMTQAQGRVTAYALFLKPKGAIEDWEKTDLWQSARSIPGVTVIIDNGGLEAERFQAVTSGQTLLYNAEGDLLFSGGITSSRGHSGDNAGRSAIVALLNGGEAEPRETPAFGCSLFNTQSACQGADDGNQ